MESGRWTRLLNIGGKKHRTKMDRKRNVWDAVVG